MTGPKLTPRKEPRQERARATVEAILIAAERLTRERGLDGWTTNHIADLAGTSIGSLYQYFPSKQSITVALYLHRRTEYLARLAEALTGASRDPRVVATSISEAWLSGGAPAIDWAFDLSLREAIVAAGAAHKLVASDTQLSELFEQLLVDRGWATPAGARPRAGFVIATIERLLVPLDTSELRASTIATLAGALRGM